MKKLNEFRSWDAQNNLLVREMQANPFYVRYAAFYRWQSMIDEAHLKTKDSVIDLGGGLGYISKTCAENGYDTTHVDSAESLLSFAKNFIDETIGISKVKFLKADLEELKLEDETFDVAFCGEVLEHINDVEKFLKMIHKILKSGGRLVLTTPNHNALAYVFLRNLPLKVRRRLFAKFSNVYHLHAGVLGMQEEMANNPEVHKRVGFLRKELLSQVESAGFSIIKSKNFDFMVPRKVVSRLPDFLSLMTFYLGHLLSPYSSKNFVVAQKTVS